MSTTGNLNHRQLVFIQVGFIESARRIFCQNRLTLFGLEVQNFKRRILLGQLLYSRFRG